MFCGKCGKPLPDDVNFCPGCGAPRPAEAAEPALEPPAKAAERPPVEEGEKKPRGKKYIMAALGAAVVVAVLLCLKIFSPSGSMAADPLCYLADGNLYIQDAGGTILAQQSCESEQFRLTRATGTGRFILHAGSTYYWTRKTLNRLSYCKPGVYLLSADGSAAAYIYAAHVVPDMDESQAYDVEKVVMMSEGGMASELARTQDGTITLGCISPDGRCVGYTITRNGAMEGYVHTAKDGAVRLGANKRPIAVSKDGEYIYYIKLDDGALTGSLYVQAGSDNESRVKIGDDFPCELINSVAVCDCYVYLNQDGSEAVALVNGSSYYCQGNERIEQIASGLLYPMIPPLYSPNVDNATFFAAPALIMTWAEKLSDQPFLQADQDRGVWAVKLNSAGRLEDITGAVMPDSDEFYEISADLNTLLYLEDGELLRYSLKKGSRELVAREVISFAGSDDGETVFYFNQDNELYRKDKDGRASFLTTAVDGKTRLWELESEGWGHGLYRVYYCKNRPVSGDTLYYYAGSTLYRFGKETSTERLEGDAGSVNCRGDAVYLYTWSTDTWRTHSYLRDAAGKCKEIAYAAECF